MPAPTILDVIDNFFGPDPNILNATGRRLMEFGEEVRRFAAAWDPVTRDRDFYPVYIGGLPSANMWLATESQLALTTLLYSDRAVTRDPISDWFADERYRGDSLMRSRPGYLGNDGATLAVAETRQFLANAIAGLQKLRPLIDRGIVVPIPARRLLYEHRIEVQELARSVTERAATDAAHLASQFRPSELAVEDNVRGRFIFAGGNQVQQLQKAFGQSIEFFAGEVALALAVGATYLAPFPFETYLVEQGLDRDISTDPSRRVVHAVWQSELPQFAGLSPDLVARIHDDDTFASFRRDLHLAYSGVPYQGQPEDIQRYIANAEEAVLRPFIQEAEHQVARGRLRDLLRLGHDGFRMAATVVGQTAAATAGVPPGAGAAAVKGVWGVVERLRARHTEAASQPVWTRLTGHQRAARSEVAGLGYHERQVQTMSERLAGTQPRPKGYEAEIARNDPWGIPDEPGMFVVITEGEIISDWIPVVPSA